MLLLRMRSHPLPEARHYADLMLNELRKVVPSFLKRVDLDDRGIVWSRYFETTRRQMEDVTERLLPADDVDIDQVADGDAHRLRSRRRGEARREHALSRTRTCPSARSRRGFAT